MYVYVYIPFLLLHVKINLDEIHDINMIGTRIITSILWELVFMTLRSLQILYSVCRVR